MIGNNKKKLIKHLGSMGQDLSISSEVTPTWKSKQKIGKAWESGGKSILLLRLYKSYVLSRLFLYSKVYGPLKLFIKMHQKKTFVGSLPLLIHR